MSLESPKRQFEYALGTAGELGDVVAYYGLVLALAFAATPSCNMVPKESARFTGGNRKPPLPKCYASRKA